jgi:hypothetical protein
MLHGSYDGDHGLVLTQHLVRARGGPGRSGKKCVLELSAMRSTQRMVSSSTDELAIGVITVSHSIHQVDQHQATVKPVRCPV